MPGRPSGVKSIMITDGLVPALQRRGLIRTGYSHKLFRDNLMEF